METIPVVLEIIKKQLQDQITEGYGVTTFEIRVREGRIVLVKCNKEISLKIGD